MKFNKFVASTSTKSVHLSSIGLQKRQRIALRNIHNSKWSKYLALHLQYIAYEPYRAGPKDTPVKAAAMETCFFVRRSNRVSHCSKFVFSSFHIKGPIVCGLLKGATMKLSKLLPVYCSMHRRFSVWESSAPKTSMSFDVWALCANCPHNMPLITGRSEGEKAETSSKSEETYHFGTSVQWVDARPVIATTDDTSVYLMMPNLIMGVAISLRGYRVWTPANSSRESLPSWSVWS